MNEQKNESIEEVMKELLKTLNSKIAERMKTKNSK